MAIEAELADGRILEFPDGTDPSIVQATVKRVLASEAPAPKQSSILGEIARGGKQLISSTQTGLSSLFGSPEEAAKAGIERGQKIATEAGEGPSLAAVQKAYGEKGALGAAGEVASQAPRAVAGQSANLAASYAGAKAGAKLGSVFGTKGRIIGGALGSGAAMLPQFFGSNVERQAQEQMEAGKPVDINRTSAGTAAAGQAALESAGTALTLGKGLVKGILGVADDAALMTAKSQQQLVKTAERSLTGAAATGAARGASEIPVEVAQQILERAQAGLDLTSPDALKEYGESAYQAGLIGGPIGGVSGVVERGGAQQRLAAQTAAKAAAPAPTPAPAETPTEEPKLTAPALPAPLKLPALPAPVEMGTQKELFPEDKGGPSAPSAEPTPEAEPTAGRPQEGQLGLDLDYQREIADAIKERESLRLRPQTPEVQARIAELTTQIDDYNEMDVERARQDKAEADATAAKDAAMQKRFPALTNAPKDQELLRPMTPPPKPAITPKPAVTPKAPEPTLAPTPTATAPNAITSQTLDSMGIQGKGVRSWFEKNVVGKTVEDIRAETEKNPTLLSGKGERPQLLRELIAPKAEPFDVTQTTTPTPTAEPGLEPGAGEPSVSLPSEPTGAGAVPPRTRRAATPSKPTPPVGSGLADLGQPAVSGDGDQGAKRLALKTPTDVRARLQAIIDNREASKRSKQIAFKALDTLDDPEFTTKRDRAYAQKVAEEAAVQAEGLAKYSKAEVKGQSLDDLKAEIAGAKGILGAALRRMVQSGKVKLEERHPSGTKIAGKFDGSTATLYADSIPSGRALSVAMHEVAAHMGLKKLLGENQYNAVFKRIESMSGTDPLAKRALDRVPQDIKDIGGEGYADEVVAYYIEELADAEADGKLPKSGPERSLWNRIKTAIVTSINRALGTSFGVNDFTAQDINEIAQAAFVKESEAGVETAGEVKHQFSVAASTESLVDSMGPLDAQQQGILTKMVNAFKLDGGVDYVTSFRTQTADIGATIEARLTKNFDGAVRDSMGRINPMGLYRQAQDYTKMLLEYFQRGAIAKDPNTKQWMVTDAQGIRPPAAVYELLDDWAKKNGYSRERGTQIASRILEGVRLDQMRASNLRGDTNFRLHLNDAQIDQLLAEYNADPDLQEMSKLMDEARVALVNHLVKVGRLSAEEGKEWSSVIGYVPFDRIEDFATKFVKNKKISGKGLAHLGKLPELVGSLERPVGNVFDNYINTLGWMVGQVIKNDATVQTLRALEDIGSAKFLGGTTQHKGTTVGAYIDGEMKYWELPSKYDVMAFKDLTPPKAGWLLALGRFSNLLRKSVTVLPPFALKQVTDDVQRAIMTSGVKNPGALMWMTLTNFPKLAFAELRGIQHPTVREFGALGLTGEYDFEAGKPASSLLKDLGYKPRGIFGTLLHRLDGITRASDLAVRKAIYDQTMKETNDALLAQTRAREFINFRRRGASDFVGAMVTTIPFFNAYIQGMDVLYRAASGKDSSSSVGRAEARRMFWSRAGTVFMLSSLYALGKSDDDEYDEMDLRTRDSNWILPGGVKIPAPGELGAVFKVIPERVVEYMRRQGTPEEQTAWEATRTALSFMFEQYVGRVTPIPQAAKPLLEAWANKSFLTGRQLEGYHHQQMDPSMRRTEQTSELAIAIANFSRDQVGVEVSPIMVDNALRGYFGTSAAMLTMTTDSLLNPTRVDRPLHKYALLSNYMYDPVGTRRVTEFYETRDSVGKAGATLRELMKTDLDRAAKYVEEHKDELMLEKAVNSTLNQLEKTRAHRKFLNSAEGAKAMSADERELQLAEIRKMEISMTQWVRQAKAALNATESAKP